MLMGRVASQTNFYFGLEKSAGKLNCIRLEMKIKLSLDGRISTSENASVNHTREILAVKLCSVTTLAMWRNRITVTLRFSFFGADCFVYQNENESVASR